MTKSDLLVGEKIWQESTSTEYHRPWEAPLLPTNPHVLNHQLVMTYNVPTGHISTSNQKHFALSAPSTNALPTSSPPHNEPVHRAVQWVGWCFCTRINLFLHICTVYTVHWILYSPMCTCSSAPPISTHSELVCTRVCNAWMFSAPSHSTPREALTWPRTQQEPNLHCSRSFPL